MPHRREPLIALVTAACVLAVLIVQQLITGIAAVIATPLFGQGLSFGSIVGPPSLLYVVVFAVGIFFVLWLFAPVHGDFTLTRVMLRGLVISALATALLFVVTVLITVYSAFDGPLGSMTGFDGQQASNGLGGDLLTAAGSFAQATPLVILAVVLLWIWQRRRAKTIDV